MYERASSETGRLIGPVEFAVTDRQGAVNRVLHSMNKRESHVFAFCNMHTFNLARKLPELADALSNATVFNDGLGIDVASLILFGQPFPENLNGTDLTPAVLESLTVPTAVFIIGSPPGTAEAAGRALQAQFPLVTVVGTHHGFFPPEETDTLVERIISARTDIVLLGMGNPRQEIWAAEVAPRLKSVILCVGAFLDFTSGRILRAPRFIRAARIEWLFRLASEPLRLSRRYIGGATPFLYAILLEKFKGSATRS